MWLKKRIHPSVRPLVGPSVHLTFFFSAEFKPKSDLTSINAPAQHSRLNVSCIRTNYGILGVMRVGTNHYGFTRLFSIIWYFTRECCSKYHNDVIGRLGIFFSVCGVVSKLSQVWGGTKVNILVTPQIVLVLSESPNLSFFISANRE